MGKLFGKPVTLLYLKSLMELKLASTGEIYGMGSIYACDLRERVLMPGRRLRVRFERAKF